MFQAAQLNAGHGFNEIYIQINIYMQRVPRILHDLRLECHPVCCAFAFIGSLIEQTLSHPTIQSAGI